MSLAYLPLNKAKKGKGDEKPDLSNRNTPPKSSIPDFSKPNNRPTKDKNYKPAVMRGLPEPPSEGDVVEAHHPKHGLKVRGRVTAVGQDGYKMRVADGSSLDVPHSHTIATLPVGDYGTETGVSPQDAKESFLGPTKEGGLPATPLQIAIMDVLAQYGFPVDEETIHTINYDQARRVITKYIAEDKSPSQMPDAGDEDEDAQESTGGATGEDQDQEDTGDDDEEDGPEATPMPPQQGSAGPENAQEGSQAAQASPSPPGAAGGAQSPSQAPTEPTDGTDVSQDGSGPQYELDQDPAVLEDPEVAEAVKNLIAALQVNSTAPGTPDQEDISNPEQAKKHPAVKKKINVLVNTAKNSK